MADLLDGGRRAAARGVRTASGGGGPPGRAGGQTNVGKSSLLNRLAGSERSVVHDVAGTTVDPVDSLIELGGRIWRFVDTAGLRRKVGQASGHEFYASVRTHGAIDAAEVVHRADRRLQPLTEQDQRVLSMVIEAGPRTGAGVQQIGTWSTRTAGICWTKEIDRELAQVQWAPRVNISAKTGRAVQKLVPALETALAWDKRISTGQLNTWLKEVVVATRRRCAAASSRASCSRLRPPRGRRRSYALVGSARLITGYDAGDAGVSASDGD